MHKLQAQHAATVSVQSQGRGIVSGGLVRALDVVKSSDVVGRREGVVALELEGGTVLIDVEGAMLLSSLLVVCASLVVACGPVVVGAMVVGASLVVEPAVVCASLVVASGSVVVGAMVFGASLVVEPAVVCASLVIWELGPLR